MKEERKTLGLQVDATMYGRVSLIARALGVTRSSVIRDALRNYLDKPGRVTDATMKLRQMYQIAWERKRMQEYQGVVSDELKDYFTAFLNESVSELKLYGLSMEQIKLILDKVQL